MSLFAYTPTDGALVISDNAEQVLCKEDLGRYFELKEKSIGPPKIYLGGTTIQVELENGVRAWALGSSQYVSSAVKKVDAYVSKQPGN